jgi:hypothetical protein
MQALEEVAFSAFRFVAQQRSSQEAFSDGFHGWDVKAHQPRRGQRSCVASRTCSVSMWQEFLGGWMAASFSPAHCEDLQATWQRLQQSEPAGAGPRPQRHRPQGGHHRPQEDRAGTVKRAAWGLRAARRGRLYRQPWQHSGRGPDVPLQELQASRTLAPRSRMYTAME